MEEYAVNAFVEDMLNRPQDERYQLKDDLDSWELVDWEKLAATMPELEVPRQYERYQHLFNQPEQPKPPEHETHNHHIPLEEEKEPACRKIYPMSEKESQALHNYVTDQLQKGNI